MDAPDKIIFPELSFEIIGSAFSVFNALGWGLPEKDYQKALAQEFEQRRIKFNREFSITLEYKGVPLSKYFADFLVEDKIILELKVVSKLGYIQAKQLLTYMRTAGIRLGILIYFTEEGVKYRRIINSQTKK